MSPCLSLKIGEEKKKEATQVLLSVLLREAITGHDYFVSEHLSGLGHDMPVQRQVEVLAPKIASLHK